MNTGSYSDLLTIEEAVDLLKVSAATMRRRVKKGRLAVGTAGSRPMRIWRQDLDALLSIGCRPDANGKPEHAL